MSSNLFDEPVRSGLFDEYARMRDVPLAERMRPRNLEEYEGQEHIVGPGGPLRALIESGSVPSCIMYGPPGVGKTTLVRLMGTLTGRALLEINAVSAKVAQLRDMMEEAKGIRKSSGRAAIAFVDEIYHFNSQQQNALLPSVETGEIVLVGTTTENPWFEINKTLLSRMIVYQLEPISEECVVRMLRRAISDSERGLGRLGVSASDDVLRHIAAVAGGDGRQSMLRLEACVQAVAVSGASVLTEAAVERVTGRATQRYDRAGDDHYSVISAFIKSIRGSDPDAAIYWLARMLEAGDDVRFIARRMCISASEDIGLADPMALLVAEAAAAACDRVGLPEGDIILAEAAIYLAAAPKSNSAYSAIRGARAAVSGGDIMAVPQHLTTHGKGYKYPHDYPEKWVPQQYLNEPRRFWYPVSSGAEERMKERMKRFWKRFRQEDKD